MRYDQRLAALLAAVMILSLVALPGVAVAEENNDDNLDIAVSQDEENVLISVTWSGDPVENATVTVREEDENESDARAINDSTDSDGEIVVTATNETTTFVFSVTHSGETVTTAETIDGTDADDERDLELEINQSDGVHLTVLDNDSGVENATVTVATVDENASYADTGNYTTDENGSVSLSEPEEDVEVNITAIVDDETVERVVSLESVYDDQPNFGGMVSLFVSNNLGETDDPFGLSVASFAVENNPGNAPAHAGPSDNGSQGPPDHAGSTDNDSDDGQGPPSHAGSSDDTDRDAGQGPPDHAGPPNDDDDS